LFLTYHFGSGGFFSVSWRESVSNDFSASGDVFPSDAMDIADSDRDKAGAVPRADIGSEIQSGTGGAVTVAIVSTLLIVIIIATMIIFILFWRRRHLKSSSTDITEIGTQDDVGDGAVDVDDAEFDSQREVGLVVGVDNHEYVNVLASDDADSTPRASGNAGRTEREE
jgi:hypothetical protein